MKKLIALFALVAFAGVLSAPAVMAADLNNQVVIEQAFDNDFDNDFDKDKDKDKKKNKRATKKALKKASKNEVKATTAEGSCCGEGEAKKEEKASCCGEKK